MSEAGKRSAGGGQGQGDAKKAKGAADSANPQVESLPESELAARLASVGDARVFVWLTAIRGPEGSRWCPDCSAAEPVIDEAFKSAPAKSLLLKVHIVCVKFTIPRRYTTLSG